MSIAKCAIIGSARVGHDKKKVTPYMHGLVYHVPVLMKNHKNFRQFTGQGIERYDDAKTIFNVFSKVK